MTIYHLQRRKSIHALPDRQSDPCSKTGCRSQAMNEDCTYGNVAHGGGYVHVWGGLSHMGNPPCAFWIRCHWSRLSQSSGSLGFTWQGIVSQQLATG